MTLRSTAIVLRKSRVYRIRLRCHHIPVGDNWIAVVFLVIFPAKFKGFVVVVKDFGLIDLLTPTTLGFNDVNGPFGFAQSGLPP